MAFNLAPSANKGKLKMESFLSDDVQLTRGEVNIADLIAWENQPFKLYSEEKMQEMMKSIEANGLITPITVRPYGEGKYQILAGHNRAEACRRLEMTTIPANGTHRQQYPYYGNALRHCRQKGGCICLYSYRKPHADVQRADGRGQDVYFEYV